MREDMRDILLDRAEIARRVKELGRQITEDYRGETPLLVCILKGSVVFFADLIRAIDLPVQLEFMTASSYGSATVSSGEVKIKSDLDEKIFGRHVILVEDIIDSGRTIAYIRADMLKKGVKSLARLLASGQAGSPRERGGGRLRRLHHPGRVRRGLRSGFRPDVPQFPRHRRFEAGKIRKNG